MNVFIEDSVIIIIHLIYNIIIWYVKVLKYSQRVYNIADKLIIAVKLIVKIKIVFSRIYVGLRRGKKFRFSLLLQFKQDL